MSAAPESTGEVLLYQTEDGRTRVECRFEGETLWLTQAQMAELFQTSKQNVAKHLKAIFVEGELAPDAVVNQWLTTASDGKSCRVGHYKLDAVLAVGFRVRSARGTAFRQWATEQLREYVVKGFALDDVRLKQGGGGVYFDELLARIRAGDGVGHRPVQRPDTGRRGRSRLRDRLHHSVAQGVRGR